jgi:hypothetical protein
MLSFLLATSLKKLLSFKKLPNWQNIAESGHLLANAEKQFLFIINNNVVYQVF